MILLTRVAREQMKSNLYWETTGTGDPVPEIGNTPGANGWLHRRGAIASERTRAGHPSMPGCDQPTPGNGLRGPAIRQAQRDPMLLHSRERLGRGFFKVPAILNHAVDIAEGLRGFLQAPSPLRASHRVWKMNRRDPALDRRRQTWPRLSLAPPRRRLAFPRRRLAAVRCPASIIRRERAAVRCPAAVDHRQPAPDGRRAPMDWRAENHGVASGRINRILRGISTPREIVSFH